MEAHSRYRPILILALGLCLAGGTWASAQESFEIRGTTLKNLKLYGNCVVATKVDMLTDEEITVLSCGEDPSSVEVIPNSPMLMIDPTGVGIVVEGQSSSHNRRIPVALRIDKRPPVSRTAYWLGANSTAVIPDPDLARSLLDELATGRRIIIRVGTIQNHFDLHGSAAAIADFRSRLRP